jgi:stage V sporulation protein G
MSWPTSSPGPRRDPYVRHERAESPPGAGGSEAFEHGRGSIPPQTWTARDSSDEQPHPSGLVISDVQVRLVDNDRLRAWATITLNQAFVIKGIRIIRGNQRVFVAMPSKQQKDGKYQDIAHPISKDFRDYLEERILDVYHRVENEGGGGMRAAIDEFE